MTTFGIPLVTTNKSALKHPILLKKLSNLRFIMTICMHVFVWCTSSL